MALEKDRKQSLGERLLKKEEEKKEKRYLANFCE
jgi:hypothetical protein